MNQSQANQSQGQGDKCYSLQSNLISGTLNADLASVMSLGFKEERTSNFTNAHITAATDTAITDATHGRKKPKSATMPDSGSTPCF
jgi:hypothetical protein